MRDHGGRGVLGREVGIGLATRFDGAKAVGPGFQSHVVHPAGARGDFGLKFYVRRRARSEQAELAFGQRAKPGCGAECEFDVAREIALVIDIAGRAVGAFGEVVQVSDAGFGAATAGTEEIPAHDENAAMGRGEEEFDDVVRGSVPAACKFEGAHAAQRNRRGAIEKLDEIRGQSVRSQVRGEGVKARGGFRFYPIFVASAFFALADQLLDCGEDLRAFAVEQAEGFGDESEQTGGFSIHGEHQPAPVAFGPEFGRDFHAVHGPGFELTHDGPLAVLAPLAVAFLPAHRQRADIATGETADTALWVNTLLNSVRFEASELVEASGVRGKRPDGLGRLGEEALLTIVIVSRGRHGCVDIESPGWWWRREARRRR